MTHGSYVQMLRLGADASQGQMKGIRRKASAACRDRRRGRWWWEGSGIGHTGSQPPGCALSPPHSPADGPPLVILANVIF